MARGERDPKPAAPVMADPSPGFAATLARLGKLLGSLDDRGMQARIAAALVLTLVSKVLIVGAPVILGDAVNLLAAQKEAALAAFLGAVVLWTLVRMGGQVLPQARDALFQPVSEEAQRRTGVAVFRHVHSLSVRFHSAKRTGGVFRTIERGVRSIDFLIRFLAFNIGPTLVELVLAAIVLAWRYGWQFSAIAVGTVVIYAAITFGITEWRLKFRREMNEADTEASARAVDSLMNFETVKSFAAEGREVERYDRAIRAYAKAAVRSNSTLVGLNAAQGVVQNLGLAFMVAMAGYAISGGTMGPGDVAAVTMVMMNLYAPLNVLGFAYREIKQSSIDMEKMFALLDEKADVEDAPDARPLEVKGGAIRFENVAFSHDGRAAGLKGVSFDVPAGTRVALVGPSGAGKSTVLRLLFRFYEVQEGRVLVDGQDVRDVTQQSLRAAIGLVPQDVVLFNDTLAYNIAYGRPDATLEEIRRAASLAQLDDLINGAPQGLETKVGERGLKVSGGERQRVGIARAILKNPAILVLDEATSSLDSGTEAEVQAALDAAARGRTTVVVAHRLSTIVDADQILVLDDGSIAERGTHGELLAQGGLYAELWNRQARAPDEGGGVAAASVPGAALLEALPVPA